MLWIYLHINKFYLFLIQTCSCRNNPLDLSQCHFEPYCWEMNVLQVYETVLKSEIYQMYSTAEAQNSPQPRVCPEGGQRATLSPHEPRESERKYTSKAGQKYQLALRRRASQRLPRTRERLPTAARHAAGDVPLGTTTFLGKGRGLQDLPFAHLQGCWRSPRGWAGAPQAPWRGRVTVVAPPGAEALLGDRGGCPTCPATPRLLAFRATERWSCSNMSSVQVL